MISVAWWLRHKVLTILSHARFMIVKVGQIYSTDPYIARSELRFVALIPFMIMQAGLCDQSVALGVDISVSTSMRLGTGVGSVGK